MYPVELMNKKTTIKRRTRGSLISSVLKFLVVTACLCAGTAIINIAIANVESAENELDSLSSQQRLTNSVKYLSSDELEGRGPGTDGINKAADYIATHFRQLGLKTDSYEGTPFQRFDISNEVRLGEPEQNQLQLTGPTGENDAPESTDLTLGFDFNPLAVGASGKFEGGLVFAGYGIQAQASITTSMPI